MSNMTNTKSVPVRVTCRDCGLGGYRDGEGVYHGDRDIDPCPRGCDDFHHWTPDA